MDNPDRFLALDGMEVLSISDIKSHGAEMDFDDPLFGNVKRLKTPPLTREEIDDEGAEAIKRLYQELEQGATEEESLLSDVGLRFDQSRRCEDGPKIVSVVLKWDESFEPRPELWEVTNAPSSHESTDPMGDWPARLLHVPSMTSLKWRPGNCYGNAHEPRYAILSYTWGHWRLSSDSKPPHPALVVSGVTWKIPAVDPKLFSVQDFEKTIQALSHEASAEYVWVDIACIDQNDGSLEGAREIGRQAKIFATAHQAFIWLLYERDVLEKPPVQDLLQHIEAASTSVDAAHRQWFWEYALPKSPDDPDDTRDLKQSMPDSNDALIMNGAGAISRLTRMPWWSSLWTLQEAFLKPNARFLDRSGHIPCSRQGRPYELQGVLSYCKQLYQLFSSTPNRLAGGEERRDDFMLDQSYVRTIERSGLQALPDRDRTSMYSCANLRQTSYPEDCIYGIMQIWDFQLGKASPVAEPTQTWTMEQLELDLGKLLIQRFPLESQLHVHMHSVHGRQSWRIGKHSEVPVHTLHMSESGHLEGVINRHGSELGFRYANGITYGHFKGKTCTFESLLEAWSSVSKYDVFGGKRKHRSSPVRISLDKNVALNDTVLQSRYSLQNVPESKQIELAEMIVSFSRRWERSVSVMLLGTVTQDGFGIDRETAIGVIVMDAPDGTIGLWKKRLGICLWSVHKSATDYSSEYREAANLLSGTSLDWSTIECLFG